MKKTVSLLLFVFMQIALFSQAKEDTLSINFRDMDMLCSLVGVGIHTARTNSEYNDIEFSADKEAGCKRFRKPKIDFKNYALIGYRSVTKGCFAPTIKKKITKEDESITVHLTVERNGKCNREQDVYFWCVIPKEEFTKKHW
ncbi:MAG: hypothetical protein JKY48_02720 [Flavobacteriales bacterium]|nr:hypothetical protein [Flavobacteriales bacterium]